MDENRTSRIEIARRAKGLTQAQAAEAIGVSRPTYAKIENGEKELTLSQVKVLAKVFGVDIDELLHEAEGTAEFVNVIEVLEKYKQMIACMIKYGADDDGKITKVKLAKLVYMTDFIYYYETCRSMSGVTYIKYPRGPVAEAYFVAVDDLENNGVILRENGGEATEFSLVEQSVRRSKISEKEMDVIKAVAKAWRGKSTEEAVEFTHKQLPWVIAYDGGEVPYGLITQEEPEMVYGGVKI
ncbi:helix-turn-helix domain-containing protein [Candidatus Saccharibacteria bacterium]|nr:helix-turn-helix domain-containing protein [Candidatus Saccharibacteria bacterium]